MPLNFHSEPLVSRVAFYINQGFDLPSARELAHCDLRLRYDEDGYQKDVDEDRESSGGPGR